MTFSAQLSTNRLLRSTCELNRGAGYNRSATRSLALRARGFSFNSPSEGPIGLRETTRTDATAPHAHTGNPGGHLHAPAKSRNVCLTIRSSSEWNEITPIRHCCFNRSTPARIAGSIWINSSLTAILIAMNILVAGWMPFGQAPLGIARATTSANSLVRVIGRRLRSSTIRRAILRDHRSSPYR